MSASIRSLSRKTIGQIHYKSAFIRHISLSNHRRQIKDSTGRNIVLVDGVRTPFLPSTGPYSTLMPHELLKYPLIGLVQKLDIDKELIEYFILGNVQVDTRTFNMARDAAIISGFKDTMPTHTVTMACISSLQSITTAMGLIACDAYEMIAAGGTERSLLNPILGINLAGTLTRLFLAKTLRKRLQVLRDLKLKDIKLDVPGLVEYTTRESMGHSADRLGAAFSVSRREQDEYACRSHELARAAADAGHLTDVLPVKLEDRKEAIMNDGCIRSSNLESLAKLKPVFISPFGTVTAGNSCPFTDGATACIVSTEAKSKQLGLKPKVYLRDFVYTAQDPYDQMLLGPAHSISKLLKKTNLTVDDVDVWEIHEPFSAQILANLKALDSDWFAQNHLGRTEKVGMPNVDKCNKWGGALSLGHPYSATGIRLAMHAANRLVREDGRLSVVSACAGGGQGVAMLLERHPDAHPN